MFSCQQPQRFLYYLRCVALVPPFIKWIIERALGQMASSRLNEAAILSKDCKGKNGIVARASAAPVMPGLSTCHGERERNGIIARPSAARLAKEKESHSLPLVLSFAKLRLVDVCGSKFGHC